MPIDKNEIETKATENQISPQNLEKDYVYGWLLYGIYNDPDLRNSLILKGGNAFRKAYFEKTRFSKDLDFSVKTAIDESFLKDRLNSVCNTVTQMSGVKFDTTKTFIREKNLPNKDLEVLEARLYFKGFYNEEPIFLKTQLDITEFDKIYLPVQKKELIHPYSDASVCKAEVTCQKAEEILASKLNALLIRHKVGDIFDLLHCVMFNPEFNLSKKEIVTTFLKKTIYESAPNEAKSLILDVPLEDFRSFWGELIVPTSYFFDFNKVISSFAAFVEDLFSQLITSSVKPTISVGNPSRYSPLRTYSSSYIPRTISYFPSNTRNTIIEAGRMHKMVELVYNGISRLVEPYSIEYYTRKKDGVGNEYLWAYDTTGGESGSISIKRFFTDKIEGAAISDYSYTPRYEVEF